MIRILILFTILFFFSTCKNNSNEEFLLLSDQEAPLGWNYFTIYKDSTFEYTSRGVSRESVKKYNGKASIYKGTIFLKYYGDSIPIIGEKVLYEKDYVEFIDVPFQLKFKTRLNKLTK